MRFEFLLKVSEADLCFFTSSIRLKIEKIYTCMSAAVEGLKKEKFLSPLPNSTELPKFLTIKTGIIIHLHDDTINSVNFYNLFVY